MERRVIAHTWCAMIMTAAIAGPAQADRVWTHIASKHWNGERYNELNLGLGYQWDVTPRFALEGGAYKNSHKRPSKYLLGSYEFHRWRRWRFRAALGLADRYHGTELEDGRAVPIGGLMIEYRWGRAFNIPGVTGFSVSPQDR